MSDLVDDFVSEFLPGFEVTAWHGLAAPKGTPIAIIKMLNEHVQTALNDSKVRTQIADFGAFQI